MTYYTNLYSPATYEAASKSDRTLTGFRLSQKPIAERVAPGDRLVCYLTKLSRWCGVMEVVSGPVVDETPFYFAKDDPFVVRFKVRPLVWLPLDQAVPIKEAKLWDALSFTKGRDQAKSLWTGKVLRSLNVLDEHDAAVIEQALAQQQVAPVHYPYDEKFYQASVASFIRTTKDVVTVVIPEGNDEDSKPVSGDSQAKEVRESIRIQALLAEIGASMGHKIWLPKADRGLVLQEWKKPLASLLDALPLNYDEATLKTIEQIDVLWLKGRSIQRAFEVEHTTSIYSGLLRMADLLALQPNMDIRLHIVAPEQRRDKVFQEIRRPVFSLLEGRPLAERCSYLSYDSVRDLAKEPNLPYMSDKVLEQYEEDADELV